MISRENRAPARADVLSYPHEGATQDQVRIYGAWDGLRIPVEPILTADEERTLGRTLQEALSVLRRSVPRTVLGYRRFVERMEEAHESPANVQEWCPFRDKLPNDLKKARRSLHQAEAALARGHTRVAAAALEKGTRIFDRYPLDPDVLHTWARAVAYPPGDELEDPTRRFEPFRRLEEAARSAYERFERAREVFILRNVRLVLKEVRRFRPSGMSGPDLFQDGVLGLHRAAVRFDPERGIKFSTYAVHWIRQAIRKALIDRSRLIRIPQGVQEDLRNAESPMAQEERSRVRRLMRRPKSLSTKQETDPFRTQDETIEDPRPRVDRWFHTDTVPEAVNRAFQILNRREVEVLRLRFGIGGGRRHTLEEIGNRYLLSRERIRQIERQALEKLRKTPGLEELYSQLQ